MAEPGIRILETLILKGPNYWSYRPSVWMRIDLGPFRERPTRDLPGFEERLVQLLPSLEEHHCSDGARGGFLLRVREGTWLGHVAEHVAIEIQNLIGINVSFGRTRETKLPGVYNLVYEMEEERVGVRAGKLALDVVEWCAGLDLDLDFPESLDDLKRLREKWALGPSTKSIVDAAAARGIPFLRLNKRSLVQLGTGVHQRRIQATIASTTAQLGVEIAGDKDMTKRGGGIVEVNAAPGFRMHVAPAEGTPRDVAGAVVDMLFPAGSPSRVPIVSVTGTNGKTTTTRLIAHIARYAGHHPGLTTTEAVYINSEAIIKGDCTGPASAQAVLRDPTVTFATLETARGGRQAGQVMGLLRETLAGAGFGAERIQTAKNEAKAVRRALALAKRDDLVVIFAEKIAKVAAQVDFERQKESR